jgi:hypothetical protein
LKCTRPVFASSAEIQPASALEVASLTSLDDAAFEVAAIDGGGIEEEVAAVFELAEPTFALSEPESLHEQRNKTATQIDHAGVRIFMTAPPIAGTAASERTEGKSLNLSVITVRFRPLLGATRLRASACRA